MVSLSITTKECDPSLSERLFGPSNERLEHRRELLADSIIGRLPEGIAGFRETNCREFVVVDIGNTAQWKKDPISGVMGSLGFKESVPPSCVDDISSPAFQRIWHELDSAGLEPFFFQSDVSTSHTVESTVYIAARERGATPGESYIGWQPRRMAVLDPNSHEVMVRMPLY